MNAIIGLFLKFSGMGWIWDKVDGAKTYIAAGASILTGALGLYNEISAPLLAHNAAALLEVAKHLPQDQSWLLIVGGFGALGLRHAVDKANVPL